jgi:hypothetical protein
MPTAGEPLPTPEEVQALSGAADKSACIPEKAQLFGSIFSQSHASSIEELPSKKTYKFGEAPCHPVRVVLNSLYWAILNSDDDYTGNLYLTSSLDGSTQKISLEKIFSDLGAERVQQITNKLKFKYPDCSFDGEHHS